LTEKSTIRDVSNAVLTDPVFKGRLTYKLTNAGQARLYWQGKEMTDVDLATMILYLCDKHKVNAHPDIVRMGMLTGAVKRTGKHKAKHEAHTKPDAGLISAVDDYLDRAAPGMTIEDVLREVGGYPVVQAVSSLKQREMMVAAAMRELNWYPKRNMRGGVRATRWYRNEFDRSESPKEIQAVAENPFGSEE